MNEIYFFIHIIVMLFFLLWSFWLGKKGLFAFVSMTAVLANFFVLKQMTLFGLSVTCTDVYMVGSFFGLGMIQELYGKDSALQVGKICFFLLSFFLVMGQIHLLYLPSINDQYHPAFKTILSQSPRILLVSIGSYLLSQQIQIYFYKIFSKVSLHFRLFFSVALSQVFDTIFFTFLALAGIAENLLHIVLFSLGMKALILSVVSPFTSFVIRKYGKKAAKL